MMGYDGIQPQGTSVPYTMAAQALISMQGRPALTPLWLQTCLDDQQ